MKTVGHISNKASLLHLISACRYCESICSEPTAKTPIACTMLSGSAQPIHVNTNTCVGCHEYLKLKVR